MAYVQQGDVLLIETPSFPDGRPILSGVLHKGDNHTHRVEGEHLLCEHEGEVYLHAITPVVLGHEEHGLADEDFRIVAPGFYKKRIVLEYDHASEESRQVVD